MVQPTFSVGVGVGPGNYDLASALVKQPFEDTDTFRGIQRWGRLTHIGIFDVETNFLIRRLRDDAKNVWETFYSNE